VPEASVRTVRSIGPEIEEPGTFDQSVMEPEKIDWMVP